MNRKTIIVLIILIASNSFAKKITYKWGMTSEALVKQFSTTIKYKKFQPHEKRRYRNKVLSYITAIDKNLEKKVYIYRSVTNPAVDYLFLKNKLLIVLEDWGNINIRTIKNLKKTLKKKYGKADIQENRGLTITSYKKNNTKVLHYSKKLPDNTYKCKVYYYASDLFTMLLMD